MTNRVWPVAAALLLLLSACESDRSVTHPPDDHGNCPLDVPAAAFACMTDAISRQQDANYEQSLSNRFVFSPTLADSLDPTFTGTTVFAGWNKTVEMAVLNGLFAQATLTDVDFGNPNALINRTTFVRWEVLYSLTVVDATTPMDTLVYKGDALIDCTLEGGKWRVTSWNETSQVPGFTTWGYLRGVVRMNLGVLSYRHE